ncbi:MAG: hypothetical protein JWL88_823 [Parcubacteria group bacterium]|nr:hypothetical protein [Parcubacteria group bacterium]
MGQIRSLDSSADYREFKEFYLSCEKSIPVRMFNKIGRKPFATFYGEHANKEIRSYQDPYTGVFVVGRHSSKGIVRNPYDKKFILEVSRTYENGETIPNYPNYPEGVTLEMWSTSETVRRGETARETFIRGLTEELGIKYGRIQATNFVEPGLGDPEFEAPLRESSVYPGVWVRTRTTWHSVETHQLSHKFKFSKKRDSGVLLNWEWIDDL